MGGGFHSCRILAQIPIISWFFHHVVVKESGSVSFLPLVHLEGRANLSFPSILTTHHNAWCHVKWCTECWMPKRIDEWTKSTTNKEPRFKIPCGSVSLSVPHQDQWGLKRVCWKPPSFPYGAALGLLKSSLGRLQSPGANDCQPTHSSRRIRVNVNDLSSWPARLKQGTC